MEYCRSMRGRRHKWSRIVPARERDLRLWAEEPQSSLLATQGYYPATQKDFMIEMIDLIQDSQYPVIWALRFPDHWETGITVMDILRMLVLQALQINSSALVKTAFPITLPQMREASTEQDWLNLLRQALRGLNRVFIALDMDLMSHVNHSDRTEAIGLVESLRTGLSLSVKIVGSASSFGRQFLDDLQAVGDCIRLDKGDRKRVRRSHVQQRKGKSFSRLFR